MFTKLLYIMSSLFALANAHIPGKFCTNIIGNPLFVQLEKETAENKTHLETNVGLLCGGRINLLYFESSIEPSYAF